MKNQNLIIYESDDESSSVVDSLYTDSDYEDQGKLDILKKDSVAKAFGLHFGNTISAVINKKMTPLEKYNLCRKQIQ